MSDKLSGKILSLFFLFSAVSLNAAEINERGTVLRLDDSIPHYVKTSGIDGNLSSVGSDTLSNLMASWAEDFKRIYPNVNIQVQASGSSTASPALTEATANIGPMSRKMKSREMAAFEEKFGYKPLMLPVAIDALAIYVNKDNPIEGLSMKQLDAIFSSTRNCGAKKPIKNWGDLNLQHHWARRNIQLFGRNSVSGTYGYFKKNVLCGGDFKNNVNEQPGSASVIQAVSASKYSIGYSGIGYLTAGVRAVPLKKEGDSAYIEAHVGNAVSGKYPLSRFLYVYVNKHPQRPLTPLTREFIKLILSRQGQLNVIKNGYIPLSGPIIKQIRNLAL
jgi:phosphate transport system substrate-binding protein